MNTDERSLIGIKGWLLLFVVYLYVYLVGLMVIIPGTVRSLFDSLATGSVRTELLMLLIARTAIFVAVVIIAWMVRRRRPQTRKMVLILKPIILLLALFQDYRRHTLAMAVAGLHMGKALAVTAKVGSVHSSFVSIAGTLLWSLAWWLYWLRSERVKQTFALPKT